LRDDAELAIVLLTNEDDCSAPATTQLYSMNVGGSNRQNIANALGPIANDRRPGEHRDGRHHDQRRVGRMRLRHRRGRAPHGAGLPRTAGRALPRDPTAPRGPQRADFSAVAAVTAGQSSVRNGAAGRSAPFLRVLGGSFPQP
jgi:hypothetical protein